MSRLAKKVAIDKLSLNLIILTNCFLCFFEEVLEMHILVMALYALAIGLLILRKKITLIRGTGLMLLYVIGILLSIVISGTTFRGFYRGGLVGMMVVFAWLADFDTDTLDLTKCALVFFGVFHGMMVVIQFLFKDSFTLPLYELLNAEAISEARHYYDRGYYAGVNTKPHETAGLIMAAIAVFFTTTWGGKKRWCLIFPLVLFFPLLLTGKRAVMVLTAACAVFLYLFVQLAKRRWVRVVLVVVGAAALGFAGILFVKANLDNPLFARFASLFDGSSFIDGTRLRIWEDAWYLFTEYPIFGVGWCNFNVWGVEYFHYYRSHSVNLDYLQFLCETGIVGFVLMMTPILFTFVRTIRVGWYAAKGQLPVKEHDLVLFAVYMQVFILLYALIEVPFYNNLFFAYYMFSSIIVHLFYAKYLGNEKKEKFTIDFTALFGKRSRKRRKNEKPRERVIDINL